MAACRKLDQRRDDLCVAESRKRVSSRSERLSFSTNGFGDLKEFVIESAVFGIEVTHRLIKWRCEFAIRGIWPTRFILFSKCTENFIDRIATCHNCIEVWKQSGEVNIYQHLGSLVR